MNTIAQNFDIIRQRMTLATQSAGRPLESVHLVAVTKKKSEADIRAAIATGHRLFGENHVQEAKEKFTPLRAAHPDLKLHLIGPLQTNKAEDAIKLFDVIETIDRPRLATELAKAIRKTGKAPEFYIEINSANEPQKAGIAPAELESFLNFCRTECGLQVTGLMTIPPQHDDPAPWFGQLKKLAERHHLPHLSMGMSGDFEAAIRCGATEIRIGTALFGDRTAKTP